MESKTVDELKALCEVRLPDDATQDNFGVFNKAIANTANNTVATTQHAIECLARLAETRKKRSAAQARFDLKKSQLMAEDEDVKAGKNAAEREAIADIKLKKEIVEKEKADAAFRDAEAECTAIEYVLACLKHCKELAGKQLDVVQKEMDLGLITRESIHIAHDLR